MKIDRTTPRDVVIALVLAVFFMTCVALFGMHGWFWRGVAVGIVVYTLWQLAGLGADYYRNRNGN